MISDKYIPNAIEPSQQHTGNVERVQERREWAEDPAIMEILTATDVNIDDIDATGSPV